MKMYTLTGELSIDVYAVIGVTQVEPGMFQTVWPKELAELGGLYPTKRAARAAILRNLKRLEALA